MKDNKKARLIAFYLPQYHPIPENDKWWGKGFTEWTNVTKAKPMFRGHHQPNLPSELGFYDLRVPETRQAQADLAQEHGIEGFCYWHYWMGDGKLLLERPLREVVQTGRPDYPFCVAWANHTWSGVWCGEDKRILVEQFYQGKQDYINHFYYLLEAFTDTRYITIDSKPFFMVFRGYELPEPRLFIDTFQELAIKEGLKGLHLVGGGIDPDRAKEVGFDASTYSHHRKVETIHSNRLHRKLYHRYQNIFNRPIVFSYKKAMKYFLKPGPAPINEYPSLIPNWDTTPRLQERAVILKGGTPELFRKHVRDGIFKVVHKPWEHRILFVKSWNEWAEGNYIEPDHRFGRQYLEVLKDEIKAG